jgi:hypothetical protein
MNHLKKCATINRSQYGFQKNLTTDSALLNALLNEVLTALIKKSKVKQIFCDVENAFDCVDHDILLYKLEIYGVKGTAKVFSQFLSNRHQSVCESKSQYKWPDLNFRLGQN